MASPSHTINITIAGTGRLKRALKAIDRASNPFAPVPNRAGRRELAAAIGDALRYADGKHGLFRRLFWRVYWRVG